MVYTFSRLSIYKTHQALLSVHLVEFNHRHVSRKTTRYWPYYPQRFSELRLDIGPSLKTDKVFENFSKSRFVKTFSKSRFVKQTFLQNFVLSLIFGEKNFFWKIFLSLETHLHTFSYMVCAHDYYTSCFQVICSFNSVLPFCTVHNAAPVWVFFFLLVTQFAPCHLTFSLSHDKVYWVDWKAV